MLHVHVRLLRSTRTSPGRQRPGGECARKAGAQSPTVKAEPHREIRYTTIWPKYSVAAKLLANINLEIMTSLLRQILFLTTTILD